MPAKKDFWSLVKKTPACWLWRGTLTEKGYGTIGSRLVAEVVRTAKEAWENQGWDNENYIAPLERALAAHDAGTEKGKKNTEAA